MNRGQFSAITISFICHLFLLFASNLTNNNNNEKENNNNSHSNNINGHIHEKICDHDFGSNVRFKSPQDKDKRCKESFPHTPKPTSTFIYEYSPPKEDGKEDYELGLSHCKWKSTCKDASDLLARFSEVSLLEPKPTFSSRSSDLLLSITMLKNVYIDDIEETLAEYALVIINHSGKDFCLFSVRGNKFEKINFNYVVNRTSSALMATLTAKIEVLLGDKIVVLSNSKIQFDTIDEICNLVNKGLGDELVQILIVTIGAPSNSSPPSSSLKGFFLWQRWFSQKAKFISKDLDTEDPDTSGEFNFEFRDLPKENFSRLKEFSSSAFSVILGNSKIRIADGHEPNAWGEFTLKGSFLFFNNEGIIPLRFFIYREGKLLAKSNCVQSFKVQVKIQDQITITSQGGSGNDIEEFLGNNSPREFLTILEGPTPHIRISIKERALGKPRLYRVPIFPYHKDLNLVEIAWCSNTSTRHPTDIIFNHSGIVAGELLGSTIRAGYCSVKAMEYYQKEYLINRDGWKPGCIVELYGSKDNDDSKELSINFILSPKSYFIVLKINKDDSNNDSVQKNFWTTGPNEENSPCLVGPKRFSVKDGDCFVVFKGGGNETLKPFWQPNIKTDDFLTRFERSIKSLPSKDRIMALMFKVEKAEERNIASIEKHTDQYILLQRWFGVGMEDVPKIERPQVERDDKIPCPYKLFWGYNLENGPLISYFEYYRLEIGSDYLLVTLKSDDQSSMRLTLAEYSLKIEIKGRVPFTLALYRGDDKVISWSGHTICEFDDFEINDRIVLIPWTFFVKNKEFATNETERLQQFIPRLNSGNLVATIGRKQFN